MYMHDHIITFFVFYEQNGKKKKNRILDISKMCVQDTRSRVVDGVRSPYFGDRSY